MTSKHCHFDEHAYQQAHVMSCSTAHDLKVVDAMCVPVSPNKSDHSEVQNTVSAYSCMFVFSNDNSSTPPPADSYLISCCYG